MGALEDNGFLYMLVTVVLELALVTLAVTLTQCLYARVQEAHKVEQAVLELCRAWRPAGEPLWVRNRMRVLRGTRLPADPVKVAEFQRIIARNNAERLAAA